MLLGQPGAGRLSLLLLPLVWALGASALQPSLPHGAAGAPDFDALGGGSALLVAEGRSSVQTLRLDDIQRLVGADGQCLNFLHIPKTAGTSIEEVSIRINSTANSGLRAWGMHDPTLKCSHPVELGWGPGCLYPELPETDRGQQRCSLWHTPPAWDGQLAASYGGCTTFCVVRDPLRRALSEAEYRLSGCNKTEVIAFVERSLSLYEMSPTVLDCHMLPQAEYVHGGSIIGSRGTYCQRVLRMESLDQDFARLMKEFRVNATLIHADPPDPNVRLEELGARATRSHNPRCAVDVPARLKERIMKVYEDDYRAFDPAGRWQKPQAVGD